MAGVRAGLVGVGLFLGLVALGLAGCSDDDDATPSTTAGRQTEFTAAIPAPTVTIGPAEPATTAATTPTTTPVVTQPVLPTSPPSAPGRTDPVGTPACDPGVLLAVVEAATPGGLPTGTGTEAPICTGGWASMVIGAPQQDRAFAVFVAEPAGWRLVTLGNDAVCTDAGVPTELSGPLGCALWETS